jgi:hypothetical protein
MAVQKMNIGDMDLFAEFDNNTYANIDAVILKPLPEYCKPNTAQVNHYVKIIETYGTELTEKMDGDFDVAGGTGCFTVGSANVIKIALTKGLYADREAARQAVLAYDVIFQLADTAHYVKDAYDVKLFDLGNDNKTFDSIVIGDLQLLALMKSHIEVADLGITGMNPFVIKIYPHMRA